jgi:hypothetical protein
MRCGFLKLVSQPLQSSPCHHKFLVTSLKVAYTAPEQGIRIAAWTNSLCGQGTATLKASILDLRIVFMIFSSLWDVDHAVTGMTAIEPLTGIVYVWGPLPTTGKA